MDKDPAAARSYYETAANLGESKQMKRLLVESPTSITTNGGREESQRILISGYHHRNLSQKKTGRLDLVGQDEYTALQAVMRIKYELSKLRVEPDEQDKNSPEIFSRGFHR